MDILTRLEIGFGNLIRALDGHNADEIIDAAAAVRVLITEVEAQDVWHKDVRSTARINDVTKLIEASRMRVNKLSNTVGVMPPR